MEAGGSSPSSCSSDIQQIGELLRSLPPEDLLRYLPPGFRFVPRDEELIEDYLQKKIDGRSIPMNIPEVPNYAATNPHTFTEQYPRNGDNCWYFFVTRVGWGRKSENGCWSVYGKPKPVMRSNMGEVIGYRRTLEFFEEGKKTKSLWRMLEYRVINSDDDYKDHVMCRIFKMNYKEKNALKDSDEESGGPPPPRWRF